MRKDRGNMILLNISALKVALFFFVFKTLTDTGFNLNGNEFG